MRAQLLSTLAVLAISLGGIAACTGVDVEDEADEAELVDGSDDSKFDQASLALTEIDFAAPEDADIVKVGVIKSKAAWKQVFGTPAPSSIRFDRTWVAYYTAGIQATGGYTATITNVRLSDTGKTLKISTRLDRPGADCFVTQAFTTPYAIVKFKKPSPATTANRYYAETRVVSCAQTCAGTSVTETTYAPVGSSNEECAVPDEHCLTTNHNACPQWSPLPPNWCPNGTVRTGAVRYIASADGMECAIPSVHCVTNNNNACPQFSPLPPNWCANGTVQSEPDFIASADGMECWVPNVHCVIDDAGLCPAL